VPAARDITRRAVLAAGVGAGLAVTPGARAIVDAAAATCPGGGDLGAVEHIVIVIQENRSFDHYFGTHRGVRGFDDHRPGVLGPFSQRWTANATRPPAGRLLPFRLDTSTSSGACVNDISHAWTVQHAAWNHGAMDRWVDAHVTADGPQVGLATMGYYTRADVPFLRALADAFTVCDGYHCSIMGPTIPNRLYSMTGTVDPDGKAGGPVIENPGASEGEVTGAGLYTWRTMPDALSEAGVSWKVYSQLGTNNNVLVYFPGFTKPGSDHFTNGLLPTWPGTFEADVATGTLPQVSWVLAPTYVDEHPPNPASYGEAFTARVLAALVANPELWARTVMVLTYDENGGFFDHVAPPVAPPGTPGEHLTVAPLPPEAGGVAGPIGLGFRVPALVLSPFARGGRVCSDTFDHTSTLRLIETRFGVTTPNLSAWRRATCGDLTTALDLATGDLSVPSLPDTVTAAVRDSVACGIPGLASAITSQAPLSPTTVPGPPVGVPTVQAMPTQEPGQLHRIGAGCSARAGTPPTKHSPRKHPTAPGRSLAATGGTDGVAASAVLALGLALLARRATERVTTRRDR
jgi:phospholipase C